MSEKEMTASILENESFALRERLARYLIRFAWLLEIMAVTVGLAIAIIMAWDTYIKNSAIDTQNISTATNSFNVLIAGLPFVMVALCELVKIPCTQASYRVRGFNWKILFTTMLVFLAVITFETALNGFERWNSNISFELNSKKDLIDLATKTTQAITNEIERAKEISREVVLENFNRQNDTFVANREASLKALADQSALAQAAANNVQVSALRDEVKQLQTAIKLAQERRDRSLSELNKANELARQASQKNADSEASRIRSLIDSYRAEKASIPDARVKEKEGCFLTCGQIDDRWNTKERDLDAKIATANKQLSDYLNSFKRADEISRNVVATSDQAREINNNYQKEIENIQDKISIKNSEIAKLAGVDQQAILAEQKRLNLQRERINQQYESELKQILEQKNQQLLLVEQKESFISKKQNQLSEVDTKLVRLSDEFNRVAWNNQIYRIALMFSAKAKTPAEVSRETVDLVSKIWFGSLALIVAFTGIMLALMSEVMRNQKNTVVDVKHNWRKTVRSAITIGVKIFRRLPVFVVKEKQVFVEKIIFQEKIVEVKVPVEIIKEIPVDRVVKHEVPIEIIKKEIEYVPIYTNDTDLLTNRPKE